MRPRWIDFLRLVIIEKCEVKDIEIGQIMTMATILENYFANGQHNINFLFFNQFTSNSEHKKAVSVDLVYSTR